jgi:DNA repair protein RadA/Sms
MARLKTIFRCSRCGAVSPTWVGRCPGCDEWNALVEERGRPLGAASGDRPAAAPRPVPIRSVECDGWSARPTNIDELDRVLDGGLVPGSVTLLGGEPGTGKSTLLLQAAASLARGGQRVLYASAEESAPQVRHRADRLDALVPDLWIVAETDVDALVGHLDELDPAVLVVDSIQAVHDPASGSAPGSVAQVRDCAARLVRESKERGLTTVLVGHVTKEGALAGPRVLEHLVDTVLAFEGDGNHTLRLLRAVKHRFGSTDELGVFEMSSSGLRTVPDPSSVFLTDRRTDVPGSAVVPLLDGFRPVLVEVQALAVPAGGSPVRSVHGVDRGRIEMVLAVLDRRIDLGVSGWSVHALAVGGLRATEPPVDLGLALAVASSFADRPLPADIVVCGEIGLGGELRQVAHVGRRLGEAARLGFRRAIVPRSSTTLPPGIQPLLAATVGEAMALAGLPLP